AMPSAAATAPAARWRSPMATTNSVSGQGDTTTTAATATKAARSAGSSTRGKLRGGGYPRLPVPRRRVNRRPRKLPPVTASRGAARFLARFAADRIEIQCEAAGEQLLALFRQRVELRAVRVAQQPLEAELAEHAGAAGRLQGLLRRRDDGIGGDRLAHQHLAGELDAGCEVE